MLNTFDLTEQEVQQVLTDAGIMVRREGDKFIPVFGFQLAMAQAAINKFFMDKQPILECLLPVQFYFLLANCGLDKVLNPLLNAVENTDKSKYAMYKAYLNGARYYEFSKAVGLYTELKDKIMAINPELDFTIEQLEAMWVNASQI
ncbi:hypothetical protein SB581_07495 [Acinetobacter baumannii]|nr:hypothetical protein SB581_07495 [Acinetobacter baumannii]